MGLVATVLNSINSVEKDLYNLMPSFQSTTGIAF